MEMKALSVLRYHRTERRAAGNEEKRDSSFPAWPSASVCLYDFAFLGFVLVLSVELSPCLAITLSAIFLYVAAGMIFLRVRSVFFA
jgi:hypothetical protein